MASKLLFLLSTFENSTTCIKISFDSDSFLEWLKSLLSGCPSVGAKHFHLLDQKNREKERDISLTSESFN